METFTMDKSFYDIGAGDLKELWDSDLDPTMQEVFRSGDTTDISSPEWGGIMSSSSSSGIVGLLRSGSGIDKSAHGVVLHDRLMTETVLGSGSATLMPPIKSEHSYSLASDGDSPPDSPISHGRIHHQQDDEVFSDMEDECFPAIPLTQAGGGGGRCSSSSIDVTVDVVNVKDEPLTDPDSPSSSCPASPSQLNDYDFELSPTMMGSKNVLKHNVLLSSRSNIFTTQHRTVVPKVNIKVEPGTSGFSLPPTPPSCTSSDDSSEDNAPATTCAQTTTSVNTRSQRTSSAARLLISAPIATRQPIHTPLISSQPKGSTGQLILTEEEKRTLLAEGYPVPTRLPLTKAEEKSLKKIRRKIKNKISAQESRRKKKEYMDQLERRVEILVSENTDYRKKIESLEDSNSNLLSQLAKLQAIVARTHPQTLSRHK